MYKIYMNYENLVKELKENYELGQIFLKNEKDLTEEEKQILDNAIEESEKEESIPMEEAMEEIYEFMEELEDERISNTIQANSSN